MNQQPNAGLPLVPTDMVTIPAGFYFRKYSILRTVRGSFLFYHIKGIFFFKLRSSPASGSYHKGPAARHSPGLCLDFNTRPLTSCLP